MSALEVRLNECLEDIPENMHKTKRSGPLVHVENLLSVTCSCNAHSILRVTISSVHLQCARHRSPKFIALPAKSLRLEELEFAASLPCRAPFEQTRLNIEHTTRYVALYDSRFFFSHVSWESCVPYPLICPTHTTSYVLVKCGEDNSAVGCMKCKDKVKEVHFE